jgi:hypothetical protein
LHAVVSPEPTESGWFNARPSVQMIIRPASTGRSRSPRPRPQERVSRDEVWHDSAQRLRRE